MRIIVLGAGIIGATTAYTLAVEGHDVLVLDRQPESGLETSFANGGLVTPATSDSWAAPGTPTKILKWLGKDDAPMLLRLSAIPGMFRWGLSFLANCREAAWRENTRAILALALDSLAELRRIVDVENLSYDRNQTGLLKIFRSSGSMEATLRAAKLYEELGVSVKRLTTKETIEKEPALSAISDKISGAVFYPGDESGDAFKFTQEISAAAIKRGVEFKFNCDINELIRNGDKIEAVKTNCGLISGDAFILSLGSYSSILAKTANVMLPIYPAKGYSISVDIPGWNEAPKIPIADDEFKVAVAPLGDRLRVAGTVEFAGYDQTLNKTRGQMLEANLAAILPNYPRGDIKHWAGLRPMTPSGKPIIGSVGLKNLFVNSGHGPLGWTLAAGSARLVAQFISNMKN